MDFLHKVKPLFTNVFLEITAVESDTSLCTVLAHLLPMLASIHRIECNSNKEIHMLEQHFPGTLGRAKELAFPPWARELVAEADIPAYLDWLNAPLDFAVHGPRFLKCRPELATANAIVDAVRQVSF